MNNPMENPYAAPQAEFFEPRRPDDPPRRRRSPPRWLWPILVLLNTLIGLYAACDLMISTLHTAVIFLGIAAVGMPYAMLEMNFRRREWHFVSDMLYFGAVLRIPFQFLTIADFIAGFNAESVVIALFSMNPYGDPTPLGNFLMTVITGTQLALMAFVLGILPAAVFYALRTRRS